MTCFDGLYLKKLRSGCSALVQISKFHLGQTEHSLARAVMVHSAHNIALLLASFNVTLPSEREKPS